MPANFDEIIDRRNTSSIKYDFSAERGYPKDVLPFWVADMDFRTPAPVIEALKQRAEHGIFGYTQPKDDYFAVLQNWFRRRHNWDVERRDLVITPGLLSLCQYDLAKQTCSRRQSPAAHGRLLYNRSQGL